MTKEIIYSYKDKLLDFVKKYKKSIVVILVILISLFASVKIIKGIGFTKRVLYFPQVGTEKIIKEIRYLPENHSQTPLENYVSEILLGPQVRRARPLFSLGTSLEFCILKENTLYIGLSDSAVLQESEAVSLTRGIEILKLNIKKNFSKITDVQIFSENVRIDDKKLN